ncbi:nuclear transport factor 2 family protein [Komagataeibacter diospyri]|uniref:nuclear transport factor 2 family protein n=1 Tax=Komagataeibacter diospyri TaxID=1932662 RepID=UPI00375693AE
MAPTSILPHWLETALEALRKGDIDGWMSIYATDAVHEFPFAPESMPTSLTGRDNIAAYMRRLPSFIRFGSLSDVRVREIGEELIVEAVGHHNRISDGAPCEITYVWFITRRNGKVTLIRDYMNPIQLQHIASS